MGLTILFTQLKIILLQCFQFSVFSFQFSATISSIQTDPMSLVNKKYFTIYLFFKKIFMRNYLPFLKGYKSISTYFSSSFLFKPNKGKIICSKKKKKSILSLLSLTKNTKRKPSSNVLKNPKIDNYSVSIFFFSCTCC